MLQPRAQQLSVVKQETEVKTIQQPLDTEQQKAGPEPRNVGNELEQELAKWISAQPDQKWSVVVKPLSGGDAPHAAINPAQQFETASIYKLLISYPLFQKVPLGEQASRAVTVKLDEGQENEREERRSVAICLDLMLRVTDNPCGEALGGYVGWGVADKALQAAGYTGTNLNRRPYMITTARDTAEFLADLYNGDLLDTSSTEHILSILSRQQITHGIPRGCDGCNRIMNKTGDWNGVRHDVGIIEHAGGVYVLVIFSEGGSYSQIAELTRLVHSHMR